MYTYLRIIVVLVMTTLLCGNILAQSNFPALSESKVIIQGDKGKWDENKAHTLSVVEVNKDGYKYWGYMGLAYYGTESAEVRKAGLVRSNDLIHWDKYEGNPIINGDCRWPTVVYKNGVFSMFYAEYDKDCNSRIVMVTSKDGIKFENKTEVVAMEKGKQNQNPFIYFNKQDNNYYLAFYHGLERSKEAGKNKWDVMIRKSKTLAGLKNAKSKLLLTSPEILAAPSVTYYNNKYYLLVEAYIKGKWDDKWVTLGYESDKIDGGYKEVNNTPPVLADNDACAFEYVFGNDMYIFYSHCIDLDKWNWELRMVKTVK
jgi:hypothetical protein